MILYEKTKEEFGWDFGAAPNRAKFYCICDYCGKEFLRCKKTILECNKNIDKDSCGVGLCKKKKSEEVQMKLYGVPHVAGTPEKQKKKRETCLKLYGAEHYNQSEICKERNQEMYGADYFTQTDDFREKVKKTCQEKWGVDHYMQNPEFREQWEQRMVEIYGVNHYSKTDEFKEKLCGTTLEKYGETSFFKTDEFKNLHLPTRNLTYGKTQLSIQEYLNNFGFNFHVDTKILGGKEIDLLDEDVKLGVEYSGLYWHNEMSSIPKLNNYHYDKWSLCAEKGIQLITIFEDEWKTKNEQCKSILKSTIGLFDNKIFAEDCVMDNVSHKVYHQFCSQYHIQDPLDNVLIGLGLFYENELITMVSLGRSNGKTLELDRFCSKHNWQVIGGAPRLFDACKECTSESGYSFITAISDNRWSDGSIYKELGFSLDKELPPDYTYVNFKKPTSRLFRENCGQYITSCPEGKTEHEWMIELGFARIWDCGKKRWLYSLEK